METRRQRIARIGEAADSAARAEAWKLQGNDYYKAKDYDNALDCYQAAVAVSLSVDAASVPSKLDVYYCNLAACLQQLEDDAGAIAACTSAIEESPKYVKAYMRRSQAYEKLQKYTEALADLENVVKLDPSIALARKRRDKLKKLEAERLETLKDETMSKLKDLGNSILGNFGMSTDNFKFEQDPATGSYSVNFVNNP